MKEVANPPCGVETVRDIKELVYAILLLIHRVELKLLLDLFDLKVIRLLIHRVELKLFIACFF